ncbi:MAG: hypothetical protein BroJett003_25780 [Planctomycetota bacterium]|nr:MAG: hypothetical protein BroJett003_25780 [Planctomycetota bacterium]
MKRAALIGLAASFAVAPFCHATWSIVIVDTRTGEIAIGSATCLTSFDLLAITPVVRVGVGGAVVQAAGDFPGVRRPIIRREFLNDSTAKEILDVMSRISGHEDRQFGIVDARGGAVSFTGSRNGAHASGRTGRDGSRVWAVQGNVITGRPVIREMHREILKGDGDLAERLMLAMEAAYRMGGDGRCSCSDNDPDGCGAPPPEFKKTAHIGYMLVARLGDVDSDLCDRNGCARGDYFMTFNVAFQQNDSPDPVLQLRAMYDGWRGELLAQPDGIQSETRIDPRDDAYVLHIALRNWQGVPIDSGVESVIVEHAPDSAGASEIGPVVALGGGEYEALLTPNDRTGVDRFVVTVDAGARPVTLSPYPVLKDPCGVLVDATRAKLNDNGKLKIAAHLSDASGAPVPDHEVIIKIPRFNADPVEVSFGPSDEFGRVRGKFSRGTGDYLGSVQAVFPPDSGGQCLDPDLPGQRLRSRRVRID